ncbi:MAG: MBL fold metallo-hydrolase, partial [Prosthecobacter sp.]|nr:MBL fold metallo-hydrolase [Prosthecobacter sp.]
KATEIFRLHVGELKPEAAQALFMRDDPFGFEGLRLIRSVDESKALNKIKGPTIIISASGMAESGRILHHLRQNITQPENILLFVGYCAENTLGWKLRNGYTHVNILGDDFPVRAEIETLDSFSGHADHDEMLAWFSRVGGPKKHVFLVHGEPQGTEALRAAVQTAHPSGIVQAASLMQEVVL